MGEPMPLLGGQEREVGQPRPRPCLWTEAKVSLAFRAQQEGSLCAELQSIPCWGRPEDVVPRGPARVGELQSWVAPAWQSWN
jgi:hypothetical protein